MQSRCRWLWMREETGKGQRQRKNNGWKSVTHPPLSWRPFMPIWALKPSSRDLIKSRMQASSQAFSSSCGETSRERPRVRLKAIWCGGNASNGCLAGAYGALSHRSLVEYRVLRDERDPCVVVFKRSLSDVLATNEYGALRRLVEPSEDREDGGLSSTRRSAEGDWREEKEGQL